MHNVGGYSSWRWLFILEGIFTILVAACAFFILPDWPEQAKFLQSSQREVLLQKLDRDCGDYVETKSTLTVLKDCLTDYKVFLWYTNFPELEKSVPWLTHRQCVHVLWHCIDRKCNSVLPA